MSELLSNEADCIVSSQGDWCGVVSMLDDFMVSIQKLFSGVEYSNGFFESFWSIPAF